MDENFFEHFIEHVVGDVSLRKDACSSLEMGEDGRTARRMIRL